MVFALIWPVYTTFLGSTRITRQMQSRLIQPLRVIANIRPYTQSEILIYIYCMDGVFYKEFSCTTCFVIVFYRCLCNWNKSNRPIIVMFQDMFIIDKYYDWLLIEIFNDIRRTRCWLSRSPFQVVDDTAHTHWHSSTRLPFVSQPLTLIRGVQWQ